MEVGPMHAQFDLKEKRANIPFYNVILLILRLFQLNNGKMNIFQPFAFPKKGRSMDPQEINIACNFY